MFLRPSLFPALITWLIKRLASVIGHQAADHRPHSTPPPVDDNRRA